MNLNTCVDPAGLPGGEILDVDAHLFSGAAEEPLPEPVVRVREEHNISRRDIDPDALKVLYRLARNKYTAYLVGGGVRDLLLGRKPKDFDISTNAKPEQIRELFRNCILIGRRFRLAHIRYGEKIIETSTFRRTPECNGDPADPETDLFQKNDNLFGTPQEDALRRDFTVNGLFYDIETFSIIDYVGGMEDLATRRIRCIGDPCIRFREDPVRMVRAVRFASRLDFSLDSATLDAIRKHGEELAKASPARLLEEITRLFAFSSGERAVRLLHTTGLLRVILPEVADCLDDDGYDCEAFWNRLRALDQGDTVLPDATPGLIFAVILLDPLQKKLDRQWQVDDFPRLKFDRIHSFLDPISLRLRFPRKLVDRIVHMYLSQHRFNHTQGGKKGSIANFVTQDSFHESLALAEILLAAEGRPQSRLGQWRDMLAERIYGREESGQGERRRHGNEGAGQPEGKSETAAAPVEEGEELPAGKKLSRSARRRRNKRLRRRDSEPAGAEAAETATVEPKDRREAAADAKAGASEPAPAAADEAPAPAGTASPDTERERKPKAARQRERGGRGRRNSGGNGAPEKNGSAEAPAEPPQPLTAATFYASSPEPEKKAGGKGSSGPAKEDARETARDKESPPREREPSKPLPMDLADEADTPMHWLDEI